MRRSPKGTGPLRGSTDQDRRRRGAAWVVPERPGAASSRPQQSRKPCSGVGDAERLGALGRFRVSTAGSANPRRRERRQPFQKQSLSGFANPSAQTADVRKSHRSAAAVCGWQAVRPGRACCPQRGTFFAGSLPRGSTHSRNIPPPMLQKRGLEKEGAETAAGSAARSGQARGAPLGLDIQPAGRPGGRMQGTDRRRPTYMRWGGLRHDAVPHTCSQHGRVQPSCCPRSPAVAQPRQGVGWRRGFVIVRAT